MLTTDHTVLHIYPQLHKVAKDSLELLCHVIIYIHQSNYRQLTRICLQMAL